VNRDSKDDDSKDDNDKKENRDNDKDKRVCGYIKRRTI